MIARFDSKKDHRTFLHAARRILNHNPYTHFILCGDRVDETNPDFKLLLQETGAFNGIHLLGPREDIPQIMAAMDVVVSSSAFGEGFPNVIGEAMATEVPCVVTDVGDSAKIVGQTGRVVAPKNPNALADGVIELLNLSVEKRQELGGKARKRIRDYYSLEKIVRDYEKLYRNIAGH
jgi:glycosyltransferase involved in cell wall biosynthesis